MQHLATLQSLKDSVSNVYIPLEVIKYVACCTPPALTACRYVDAGKNPHTYTREFVERVAGENMYTHGIRSALSVRCSRTSSLGLNGGVSGLQRRSHRADGAGVSRSCRAYPSADESDTGRTRGDQWERERACDARQDGGVKEFAHLDNGCSTTDSLVPTSLSLCVYCSHRIAWTGTLDCFAAAPSRFCDRFLRHTRPEPHVPRIPLL